MKRLLLPSLIVLALAAGWSFAAEITDLNTTDASNTNSTFGIEDTTAPSAVADRYQAFQGAMARYLADVASGLTVSSSSSTAYAVTANNLTTTLIDGWQLIVEMTPTNSAVSPTLNVNNSGAKRLESVRGTSLSANDIIAGSRILVSYDQTNDVWLVIGGLAPPPAAAAEVHTDMEQDASPELGGNLGVQTYELVDGSGNELLEFATNASAVNHILITNSATTATPSIKATGGDSNVGLLLQGKGVGHVQLGDAGLEWPDADGSDGQLLSTNGGGSLSFVNDGGANAVTTDVNVSGGADALFTLVPSGTTQILINFEGVSSNGTGSPIVTLGDSGGLETSGYVASTVNLKHNTATVVSYSTSNFPIDIDDGTSELSGVMILSLKDATNNTWVTSGVFKMWTNNVVFTAGHKSLSAELTQLKVEAPSSDVFDGGSVSITFQ
jgi:hypothetical protein